MIGRQSYHRRSLEGKSKTHTRAMYTDSDYRKAIVYTYAKLESWHDNSEKFTSTLKTATKTYSLLCCPYCITTLNSQCNSNAFDEQPGHLFLLKDGAVINSGLYGNLRHYRFHCLNEDVQAVRNKMTHLLENHLTALFRIASKWGRQGFSTLLTRAINALIALDRSPYHNASSNNYMHMKTLQSQYACLTSEDWITFIETQNFTAQDNFMQWPLTHQLGVIPANCYSLVELADGDHSPCDLISMGIIPLTLQEVILQFAKELGVKQCQETKKDFMQQWHQVRAAALLRAISVAMAAGAHVAEYKSSLLPTLPASLLLGTADLTTANSPNPQLIQQTSAIPPGENKNTCRKAPTPSTAKASFECIGISCSSFFVSSTNLRSSTVSRQSSICRRCSTMSKAIACANSIEQALAANADTLNSFINTAHISPVTSLDSIINAISLMNPLPPSHQRP
jgi:hypothetical protein